MADSTEPSGSTGGTPWLRLAGLLVGVGVAAWSLLAPGLRASDGTLTSRIVLPLAAGIALAAAGAATGTRFGRAVHWAALLLVGQAASLTMVNAGPSVRYQHLERWENLARPEHRLAVALLAFQALMAGVGLWARRAALADWLRRATRPWLVGAFAIVLVLSSATLSLPASAFLQELVLASFLAAVALATIILAGWSLPDDAALVLRQRFDRLFGAERGNDAPGPLVWGAAGFVIVTAALLNLFAYGRHPHIPDEVGYLFHAGYFAQGKLYLPAPPAPDAFNLDLRLDEGNRVYSPFPPGWPAALAIGVKLGVPWLMNPLLGGLNLFLVFALLRRWYDARAARLAVLLMALSPWNVFLSMSFMAHTFTLTCVGTAALGVQLARERRSMAWAALAGIAAGFVTLIRPLDGLILGGLLGLWAIGLGGERLRWGPLVSFGVTAALVTALNLPYNRALTGNARTFPVIAYFDKYYGPHTNDLGFGPQRGVGWVGLDPYPGHNLRDAAINTDFNVFATDVELYGWATGSLLVIVFLLLSGGWRPADRLMVAAIVAVICAHSVYWFSGGPDFGARYWYLALLPGLGLTVSGLRRLAEMIEAHTPVREAWTRAVAGALCLSLAALVSFYPWRATDKYHNYRGMRPDLRSLAAANHFGRSLILVRGNRHPDYASAAAYNPPDFTGPDPLYAWDRDSTARAEALQAFPDRPVWLINGPSVTGNGYRVVAGPLPADSLLTAPWR